MKVCRYHPDKRCFYSSCDFIDSAGNVRVCRHHPNPSGYFMRKRVKVSPVLESGS